MVGIHEYGPFGEVLPGVPADEGGRHGIGCQAGNPKSRNPKQIPKNGNHQRRKPKKEKLREPGKLLQKKGERGAQQGRTKMG